MYFESDFDRLKPLLEKVIKKRTLNEKDIQILNNFQASNAYANLPKSNKEAEQLEKISLYLLKQATDMLLTFSQEKYNDSLEAVQSTQNLMLVADPFDGLLYACAAKIAELANNISAQTTFTYRYETYQTTYEQEKVLLGNVELLDPEIQAFCDEVLEETNKSPTKAYNPQNTYTAQPEFLSKVNPLEFDLPEANYGFTHVAVGEVSPDIKIFTEPNSVRFVVFESVLVEVVEEEDDENILNLAFELLPSREAEELLASLKQDNWTVRFISKDDTVWEFATDSLTLEIARNQINLELKQPNAWLEQTQESEVDWEAFWFNLALIAIIPEY